MSRNGLCFLRPCLATSFVPRTGARYAKAYLALQRSYAQVTASPPNPPFSSNDFRKRVSKLEKWRDSIQDFHPRRRQAADDPDLLRLTPKEFHSQFGGVTGTVEDTSVEVFGRVVSVRSAGSSLVFMDIQRDGCTVQVLCNARIIDEQGKASSSWKAFKNVVRKGDWFSIVGHPTLTPKGTVSIEATATPICLSPALHQIPDHVENDELLARRPHVKSMIDAESREIMILRDRIKGVLEGYLRRHGFIGVDTPILEVGAGGANARPFETESTELPNAKLKLRVAPELSLKRLIIGGQEKVFEVGRVFRNEGIDTTHNPEFTTCEFYEVGATIDDLMKRTQDVIMEMATSVTESIATDLTSLPQQSVEIISGAWQRLPFISTIEGAINQKLPELSSESALEELKQMFKALGIPVPAIETVPRLLGELEDRYLVPLCTGPTFITHHPECLSPLAKSYVDPTTGQRVAPRAELYIAGREYVNCYEEENSPWEQRRKFIDQAKLRALGDEEALSSEVDESYLEALEWGMPPTGGWGCGVDRLVMLFSGKERIADVLPLGNLRNVVAIAGNGRGRR